MYLRYRSRARVEKLYETIHLQWLQGERLRTAVKQIGPLKASSARSMHVIFYKKYWNVIGKTIFNMIKAFVHHSHLLKEVNNTHITLTPEKKI